TVDGQDVFAVREAMGEAVARARRGEGPTFIEAETYRYYGHFEGDSVTYRNKEEEEFYRGQDCLLRFRETVLELALLTQDQLDTIDHRTKDTVEAAVQFAQESPEPEPAETLTDVYVDFPEAGLWPFQAAAA
ncbi:MAG: thiamine pyrophosphate-dependent enzyme, partial [Candidatus Neomarinimicrobiota bacterium]